MLIATATFWQGVDVQGESLSLLVIDKLPFSALRTTRSSRPDASGSRAEGGDWFGEYSVPDSDPAAAPGLRPPDPQPGGRGGGCDPRHAPADARLRRRFLAALPPCPVVSDLDDVAALLRPTSALGYGTRGVRCYALRGQEEKPYPAAAAARAGAEGRTGRGPRPRDRDARST